MHKYGLLILFFLSLFKNNDVECSNSPIKKPHIIFIVADDLVSKIIYVFIIYKF